MANSTLKFAANGFWGNSNSTKSNDDLDSVTTQLEKLPIKCEKDVSPEKTISSNHDQDKSSTVALSIPRNMKSTSQVAGSDVYLWELRLCRGCSLIGIHVASLSTDFL